MEYCTCTETSTCSSCSSSSCSSYSSCSSGTFDIIKKVCNESCEKPQKDCYNPCRKSRRYDPGSFCFQSIITPLTGLTPGYSNTPGCVEFRMRRKNKTVFLQWEPFTGTLSSSGVSYLTVTQSICNTPPYPISTPIFLDYKGVGRITHVEIDPFSKNANIKFFLNTDGSSSNISSGDSISVPGGCVEWIVD
jgi:hypothetical protein